ncbi:MAG TPA: hypothetical protein V6C58_10980 [Allocoleopsis sp.]
MRNKKGSMELSVNSIVILVIAIVMLGLILGFVRSKFSGLDKQIASEEPEAQPASPGEPLTISRENIIVSPGEDVTLKIQVYGMSTIDSGKPSLSCTGSVLTTAGLTTNSRAIKEGETTKFLATLKIASSAPKGKNLCTLSMEYDDSNTRTKDVIIEVR